MQREKSAHELDAVLVVGAELGEPLLRATLEAFLPLTQLALTVRAFTAVAELANALRHEPDNILRHQPGNLYTVCILFSIFQE